MIDIKIAEQASRTGRWISVPGFPGVALQVRLITPGEIERDLTVAPGHLPDFSRLAPYERFLRGAQLHVLTIMGEWWGRGPVRFPDELTIGYTKFINGCGGVVTWDVPLTPAGLIAEEFRPQVDALARALR